jgi:hypothetical protein
MIVRPINSSDTAPVLSSCLGVKPPTAPVGLLLVEVLDIDLIDIAADI